MPPTARERQLREAAQQCGLKLVIDRYSAAATGCVRYFLRPIWDARRAIRVRPDGGYELVQISANGRRKAASLLSVEEVEQLLGRWTKGNSCPPARLPWQVGAGHF